MDSHRPDKTLADYLVIAISPVLIMLLVGSLCFFLIEVFYRGEAVGGVRWVMAWFIFAVVLIARLGIEQGPWRAALFGLILGWATSLYLSRIHPSYLLGVALLAIVWWCANRLTRDCTLIDEDQDASGHGLMEKKAQSKDAPESKAAAPAGTPRPVPGTGKKSARRAPHAPGKWIIYFSVAALPLFGFGQMVLPADDPDARRKGYVLLMVYLGAAVGLLLTTSFLGLRRYLRQRHLQMPGTIAFGWVRFGASVAVLVLVAALLLPRPGAGDTWKALRYRIDYQLRQASEFAANINPHGTGEGHAGSEPAPNSNESGAPGGAGAAEQKPGDDGGKPQPQPGGLAQGQSPAAPAGPPAPQSAAAIGWYRVLRILFLAAVVLLVGWWLLRYRQLIGRGLRALLDTVKQFFRTLFGFHQTSKRKSVPARVSPPEEKIFSRFENPFITGKDRSWTLERLILYSYEAIRTWAAERGTAPLPQQTAREFCRVLSEKFPEVGSEIKQLSFLYGHAAYAAKVPEPCDLEPVRSLWRYLSGR